MKKLLSAFSVALSLALCLCALQQVQAQTAQPAWPTKPLRFLVAAPAGSSLDVIARAMGDKLAPRLGQTVVVENVAGGSGTIATNMAAKATPDGHTFVLSFNGPLAFTQYLAKLPYDPARDLTPVIMTTSQPNVLAVNASLPVKTTQELVTFLRANPAKYNYASVGIGSSSHLAMELFKFDANIFATHIPYNGSPPATFSVAANDTQMIFTIPTIIMPQVKAGKMRALAVSSPKRFSILPEIPTVREASQGQGAIRELAQFEALAWNGLLVPSATPKDVVQKMNREFDAVLKDEAVRARLTAAGLEVVGGSSEYFAKELAAETKKWKVIIEKLGIRQE